MYVRKCRAGALIVVVAGVLAAVAFATAVHGVTEPASASGRAVPASEPWDLVWITDSTGWGVAPFYARQIKQTRGVAVRVHDEWVGGLDAVTILRRLRTPSDPWTSLVRNAEVIVVYGSPVGLEIVRGGDCVSSSAPPRVVGPRAWPKYIAEMKAIYKRIFEIRKGKPVILRTTTAYVPVIHHAPNSPFFPPKSWDKAGITSICTKKWEWYSWAISKAAAAYRVRVADVYTAFNGKTHLKDPVAKGYIQSDGIHPNNEGRAVIAKTLAHLGYKHVTPPR
jgi:hypothetical protein